MTMPNESKVIITIVAFAVAMLLLRICNLKRSIRSRQYPCVFLCPILSAIAVAVSIAYFSEISFAEDSQFYGAEILVWNFLILVAVILLKLVFCLIFRSIFKKNSAMENMVDTWYQHDDLEDLWFLRNRYVNIRIAWRIAVYIVAIVSAAFLAVGWIYGPESSLWIRVFPIAGLITVSEVYSFLSGYTKEEYVHDVGGESISYERVGSYHKLRKIYEQLFPAAMLFSHTGNEFMGKEGASKYIEDLIQSNDPIEHKVGNYFDKIPPKNGSFDVDLVSMTSKLLHRESVVVFNPFYKDLSDYILLPLVDSLLNNKKCLIIVGREAQKNDIISWSEDVLKNYSRTRSLWRVRALSKDTPDCEVGVMSFSQLYDLDVQSANTKFFGTVGFGLIIEPSKMITTSQSGLGMIVDKLNKNDPAVFCICDHDTDGLVDTMSHVLQINLTSVISAPIPKSTYSIMGWASTGEYNRQQLFDRQTHFLGNGVELAAVALKNQVPHVTWYGAEKAPVKDISWIAGQYYAQICRYAHLPNQQKALEDRISFSSDLFSSTVKKEEFVIVEDEFCNLFSIARAYATRGSNQIFVNVIAENYLLRDYMRYNRQMFQNDPKIIPAIAAHYSKTERNAVIRLIFMMVSGPVEESYVEHELKILGRDTKEVYKTLSELINYYTNIEESIVTVQSSQELSADMIPVQTRHYMIPQTVFDQYFADTLKNAFIVVEDEKLGRDYIDARLFEHLTQIAMPGQLLTHGGKLYRIHLVSPQVGCVLHRAADAYTERKFYKQLRRYNFTQKGDLLSSRKVVDIEIAMEQWSFSVSSRGYLEMRDNGDLRTAKLIDFSDDPNVGNYTRQYKNKTVLRISLPDADENVRFTICILLNEVFRTVFPDAWPYLAALTSSPEGIEGILNDYVYGIEGGFEKNQIYIVEDSDMDLGLLEAVDNNLGRIFEIIADFLRWHFEKMREYAAKDPVPAEVKFPEEEQQEKFLARIIRQLGKIFRKPKDKEKSGADDPSGKKKPDEEKAPKPEEKQENDGAQQEPPKLTENDAAEEAGNTLEGTEGGESAELSGELEEQEPEAGDAAGLQTVETEETAERKDAAEASPEEEDTIDHIVVHEDFEDYFGLEGVPDDLEILMPIPPTRYQKECFLKFGFDEIDRRLVLEDVKGYLNVHGWGNNSLTRARRPFDPDAIKVDLSVENHCDFCQLPLSGVSYERLADGRVRCNDCAMTAIDKAEDFVELFKWTESLMEDHYHIAIKVPVKVRTTDAREIGKLSGAVFKPTTGVAARVLGFAQFKDGKYSLYIENGSPRLASIDTITHELTHIWQYVNWDRKRIDSLYPTPYMQDLVYEGMAVWAAIQILFAMGENTYAEQQKQLMEARTDCYGQGFVMYCERYGLQRTGEDILISPFTTFPPI